MNEVLDVLILCKTIFTTGPFRLCCAEVCVFEVIAELGFGLNCETFTVIRNSEQW